MANHAMLSRPSHYVTKAIDLQSLGYLWLNISNRIDEESLLTNLDNQSSQFDANRC